MARFEDFTQPPDDFHSSARPHECGIQSAIGDAWGLPPSYIEKNRPQALSADSPAAHEKGKSLVQSRRTEAGGIEDSGAGGRPHLIQAGNEFDDWTHEVLTRLSRPSNTDDGARAIDTQREQVNRKFLKVGIELPANELHTVCEQFSHLQAKQQAQVIMAGAGAFLLETSNQSAQVVEGIYEGTTAFAGDILNFGLMVGKTALGIAAMPQQAEDFAQRMTVHPAEAVSVAAEAGFATGRAIGAFDRFVEGAGKKTSSGVEYA